MQNSVVAELSDTKLEETVRVSKGRTGYAHRAPWNNEEKAALRKEFRAGMHILDLAKSHHRTPNAILVQLCKMRCITQEQRVMLATTMHFDVSVPDANEYHCPEAVEIDFNF